ncbi:MAG: peptidoglycan-binding domain-containing protein [Cyanobacteria bacterium J06559_3]
MKTFKQLVDALEPDCLRLDDSGAAVETLQLALQELAFYSSRIDGYFGPSTSAAVRRLQQHFGLSATGQFDVATWYALTFWAEPLCGKQVKVAVQSESREPWQLRLLRPFYSHR